MVGIRSGTFLYSGNQGVVVVTLEGSTPLVDTSSGTVRSEKTVPAPHSRFGGARLPSQPLGSPDARLFDLKHTISERKPLQILKIM